MPELIAKKRLTYAGRRLSAGQRFRAGKTDARALRATGIAESAPPELPEPSKRRKYNRRDMTASDE